MKSELPKVLHRIRGRTLIEYVLKAARAIDPDKLIVIVGHKRDEIMKELAEEKLEFVVQDPQLGTGHAVMQAQPLLNNFTGEVVILSGDVPLLRGETLRCLIARHRSKDADATVLSTTASNPLDYGRIIRDRDGRFVSIVEERDATIAQRDVKEINSGIYCFRSSKLLSALTELKPENAKGEYYLTDAIKILRGRGCVVQAIDIAEFQEVMGINTVEELEAAESAFSRLKVTP